MGMRDQKTIYVGDYVLNQVAYERSSGGLYGSDYDVVCQCKRNGSEVCHCTWHPDGTIHPSSSCPCYGCSDCLLR